MADRGNLPQALKLLRTRLDVNCVGLARHLGQTQQRLHSYENGLTEPSFAVLRKMLDGMGFDLHDLQDALDAVEDRPPRAQRLAPSGRGPAPGELGLGDAEKSFLLLFMRSLARAGGGGAEGRGAGEEGVRVPPTHLTPFHSEKSGGAKW
ncbi:MAG: helix-turn-helix domain-containing protein [Thermoanaerobaculia bacterium]